MYTRFQENDIVNPGPNALVTSTWSDNTNNLQVAHTSSIQAVFTSPSSSGQFFIEVFQKDSSQSDKRSGIESNQIDTSSKNFDI